MWMEGKQAVLRTELSLIFEKDDITLTTSPLLLLPFEIEISFLLVDQIPFTAALCHYCISELLCAH